MSSNLISLCFCYSKEVRQLRVEKINLQRDEEIIKTLLAKLKTQLDAIQVILYTSKYVHLEVMYRGTKQK